MDASSWRFGNDSLQNDGTPYVAVDAPELEGRQPRRLDLAPGIAAVLPAVYVVPNHEGLTVRMMLDQTDEGLRAIYVGVYTQDGTPVTGQSLRAVRVDEIFKSAAANIIQAGDADPEELRLDPIALPPLRMADAHDATENAVAREAGGGNVAFLERVAASYQAASVSGLPPQRFVMDVFNAPRSTAGYWISQARKRGLLPPSARKE